MATLLRTAPRATLPSDGFEAAWSEVRGQLLRYIETRLQEVGGTPKGRGRDMNPTKYRDGQRVALLDSLETLNQATSFLDVFVAGRTLKRKLADAHRIVTYSEGRLRQRYAHAGPLPPDAFGDGFDEDDAMQVVMSMDHHVGRRDTYATVVSCIQELFTL